MRKWNWAPKQKHILFDEIDSRLRLIRKKCEPIQSYCRSYCRSEKTALIIWDIRCFVTLYLCFGFYISILPFSVSLNLIFLRYQTLSLLFFVKLSSVLHNTLLANHKSFACDFVMLSASIGVFVWNSWTVLAFPISCLISRITHVFDSSFCSGSKCNSEFCTCSFVIY